ncbi:hypothetical protein TWF281_002404 [Arthrobotrys megalospora]
MKLKRIFKRAFCCFAASLAEEGEAAPRPIQKLTVDGAADGTSERDDNSDGENINPVDQTSDNSLQLIPEFEFQHSSSKLCIGLKSNSDTSTANTFNQESVESPTQRVTGATSDPETDAPDAETLGGGRFSDCSEYPRTPEPSIGDNSELNIADFDNLFERLKALERNQRDINEKLNMGDSSDKVLFAAKCEVVDPPMETLVYTVADSTSKGLSPRSSVSNISQERSVICRALNAPAFDQDDTKGDPEFHQSDCSSEYNVPFPTILAASDNQLSGFIQMTNFQAIASKRRRRQPATTNKSHSKHRSKPNQTGNQGAKLQRSKPKGIPRRNINVNNGRKFVRACCVTPQRTQW